MVAAARGRQRERAASAGLSDGAWIGLLLGSFALYYVVPSTLLSLALLALCAVLCYARLPLAVSLVPLAMPFFMLPKHLGGKEFSLGETAIVICAVAFVAQRSLAPGLGGDLARMLRRYVPASPLERATALFLAAATLAVLAAHYRVFALRQYRLVILEPIVYYVLAIALLREARDMVRALWALAGAGVLVAVLGLGQYLFRPNTLTGVDWSGRQPRPLHLISSVYGSPDNLGLMLDRAIPVAVVLGLAALAAARVGRSQEASLTSGIAAIAVLVMAVALALTSSRGGIVTAVSVGIVATLLWRGKRDRHLELAGLGIVVAGIAAVLWKVRHGLSTERHVTVWVSALKMIRDHLLVGVGPDNFLYYYFDPRAYAANNPATHCIPNGIVLPARHYLDMAYSANAWQEPCLSHPHNIVLDAWLSTGVVGLIALVLLVVGFTQLVRRGLRGRPAGRERAVQVACIAAVLATLGHGMVDNSVFLPDLAVTFWLALALTSNLAVRHG